MNRIWWLLPIFAVVLLSMLLAMGASRDNVPFREPGISADTYCAYPGTKKPSVTKKKRTIADMAIGEAANTIYVTVDSDNRIYLNSTGEVNELGSKYTWEITRRSDGFYMKCGENPLNAPTDTQLRYWSWALPVKGFYQ